MGRVGRRRGAGVRARHPGGATGPCGPADSRALSQMGRLRVFALQNSGRSRAPARRSQRGICYNRINKNYEMIFFFLCFFWSQHTGGVVRIALYPDTFDPMTNGHLDIVERALHLFDRVIILVADNTNKQPVFSADERVSLIREAIQYLAAGDRLTV